MPDVVVDPEDVARLAGHVLDGALLLGPAVARLPGDAAASPAAFGNVPASAGLAEAATATVDAGSRAGDRLASTLEGDVDRLYLVAFHYQEVEEANARSAGGGGR